MAELNFETLSFKKKDQETVVITLLNLYTTEIPLQDLNFIGPFKIINLNTIEFTDTYQKKAELKFSGLLHKHFDELKNKLTGNRVTYINRNSGVPLIGNVAFGIVYRNSSVIEVKPVTSCNLDCVYCSISEGLSSTKNDFVVEEEYMIEEIKKLLNFVNEPVEIHIGVQGEPFLYADMELFISDLQKMDKVHTISIDTNGTLLSKEKIDRLAKNDKLQINFSLDAIDNEQAKLVAGTKNYNVNHIKEIIAYSSEKIKAIVAPVLTPGYNENEMEKIILFIKSLKKQPILGIQNYLRYKTGRNIAKELPWKKFYEMLEKLEKKHDIKLKLEKEDFDIRKTIELPKPFVENEVISVIIKCHDRFKNSVIAVSKNRNISVPNCKFKKNKKIKIKIIRDKHNIFTGKLT